MIYLNAHYLGKLNLIHLICNYFSLRSMKRYLWTVGMNQIRYVHICRTTFGTMHACTCVYAWK